MTDNLGTLGRRALLQAGAASLGAALLPGTALAQAPKAGDSKAAYEFMVKDIVYQRNGDKARLARLYQPSGQPAVSGGAAGPWRRLDQQEPHRRPEYRARSGERRHRCSVDRFSKCARGALP